MYCIKQSKGAKSSGTELFCWFFCSASDPDPDPDSRVFWIRIRVFKNDYYDYDTYDSDDYDDYDYNYDYG